MPNFLGALLQRRRFALELFAVSNIGFLAVDIFMAHSINQFREWQEWIPVAFSVAAFLFLLPGLLKAINSEHWKPGMSGLVVGWLAVAVGLLGMLLHLGNHFFEHATLGNLVYTAPFVAPLAYTGVGLLLIMNRMVGDGEWGKWVVLLTTAGFVGNFGLSLLDHAQNGFFHMTEWIGVASSAYACAFLLVLLARPTDVRLLKATRGVLWLQVLVALLGFYFHVAANLSDTAVSLKDQFLYGAPALAPLLFANLAILGVIGLAGISAEGEVQATEAFARPD